MKNESLSTRMAMVIQMMEASDKRLESLSRDYQAWASDYILKTSHQLEAMDEVLRD